MKIFDIDRIDIGSINREWTKEEFLKQRGWFFFNQVKNHLSLHTSWCKEMFALRKADPVAAYQAYGLMMFKQKHALVFLPTLASYFNTFDEVYKPKALAANTTPELLLCMPDLFWRSDVAQTLGHSSRGLDYVLRRARQIDPASMPRDVGFRRHYQGEWLCDMAVFAPHYLRWRSARGK